MQLLNKKEKSLFDGVSSIFAILAVDSISSSVNLSQPHRNMYLAKILKCLSCKSSMLFKKNIFCEFSKESRMKSRSKEHDFPIYRCPITIEFRCFLPKIEKIGAVTVRVGLKVKNF